MRYIQIMSAIKDAWLAELSVVTMIIVLTILSFQQARNYAKFLIKEFIGIYSNKDSYFSKKRIESGVGFIIAEWGMVRFYNMHNASWSISDFMLWAAVQFFVAGYMINEIQKEKKNDSDANKPA